MVSEEAKKELERIHKLNEPQRLADLSEGVRVLVLGCLCIGIVALGIYTYRYFKFEHDLAEAKASMSFQSTFGIIDSSIWKIKEPRMRGRGASVFYEASVNYQYVVAGKTYHNDQIAFPNPTYGRQEDAEAYASRYKAGDHIEVFYDLNNPQKSCLDKGITKSLSDDSFFKPH